MYDEAKKKLKGMAERMENEVKSLGAKILNKDGLSDGERYRRMDAPNSTPRWSDSAKVEAAMKEKQREEAEKEKESKNKQRKKN